jgi:RNA polymerase sigma factor (sigma-70 family)
MMTTKLMSVAANNDVELVNGTLSGNRDAFSQIVSRYQSLICSLAYSATGSLGQSEDLAQETFITAWKHLGHLRERHKLRAWLCGIARNRINNFLRREGREPIRSAEPLETAAESRAPEPLPGDQAISNEEAAILWRSMERIPELYREPLVLFYREHQSIEAVAEKLELTEDTVKQRLSRGRKMLHEEVLAFVEGALEKTAPGKNFTFGVIAALPLAVTSAKTATVGAALAKGGAAAKSVMTIGTFGGVFAILGGVYFSFMAQADDTKSPRERQFLLQYFGKSICAIVLLVAGFMALTWLEFFQIPLHLVYLNAALGFFLAVSMPVAVSRHARRRRQIQMEDGTFNEADWATPRKLQDSPSSKRAVWLKTLKYMAAGLGGGLFVLFHESWKGNFKHLALMTAYVILVLVWIFLRRRNRPRFVGLRFGKSTVWLLPVVMGAMSLGLFNGYQYLVQFNGNVSHAFTPGETLAFNLIVGLAYAALIAVLIRNRRKPVEPVVLNP